MADQDNHNTPDIQEMIRLRTQMDVVDEELGEVKSRLNDRVNEVKYDLKGEIREVKVDLKDELQGVRQDLRGVKQDLDDKINRLEGRMQWGITIAVAVIAIIVPVLVKWFSS